jgi:hypothetical protein
MTKTKTKFFPINHVETLHIYNELFQIQRRTGPLYKLSMGRFKKKRR